MDGKPSSDKDARRGVLSKTVAAERGSIDVPVLAPHLEFRPIDDNQTLLVSESFNTLLRGEIHRDLLPLLDGRRTLGDIVGDLEQAYSAVDIRRALAALASRGYIVSGEHAMDPGRAAYWSSLGASPRWAEERLAASSVAVAGDDGRLVQPLSALGAGIGTDRPTLSVIVCTDYLDDRHADLNRRRLESGAPWLLVRPGGVRPLFGPVFQPAGRGPCWACLAYRLRGHQEVHSFLRNRFGGAAAPLPRAAEPAVQDAVYGLVAAEIAKWLVLEDMAPIHRRAVTLDLGGLKCEHHPVMRRPQCPACGDEILSRPDRPAAPVRLNPSPKGVRNSGGLRSVSPEETLARYRHLISPVSGVVAWLERTTDETDPWLHVHWAGSNLALRIRSLSSLRKSLRSKSAGKGSTPGQSEASALSLIVTVVMGVRQISPHGRVIQAVHRLAGRLFQLINGISKLRVDGAEGSAFAVWAGDYREQKQAELELGRLEEHLQAFSAALPFLTAAMLFLAVALQEPGAVTVGGFLVIFIAFTVFQAAVARPGEFVAIAGESGAGKSTLFRLALGLEQPSSGSVYYDGRDLRHLNLKQLRRKIGVVPQEVRLHPEDIWDNIVGDNDVATAEDAWAAARIASVDKEIAAMPMGMLTCVGASASVTSGGETQRIVIAQALMRNPRVLLLDEATNWLDNDSQARVMENLARLSSTRFVIAHRLSTLRQADRIFVMQAGKVVQEGTFAELAETEGAFQDLVRRQVA